jgi:threonine/homoserine/homoserine lactone efflux protein
MVWIEVLPLVGAFLLAMIMPGPDFLATVRSSIVHSRRSGIFVGLGVNTGVAFWSIAALLGISVVMQQFEWLYTTVRIAGAVFLIGFGVIALWNSRKRAASSADQDGELREQASGRARTPFRDWRFGLLTNLANPKALIFFSALFASLLPPETSLPGKMTLLVVLVSLSVLWFALVAIVASAPFIVAAYKRARRRLDQITGGLFVGMGGYMLTQ